MRSGKHAETPLPSICLQPKPDDRNLERPPRQPRPVALLLSVRALVSHGEQCPHALALRGLLGQRQDARAPIVAIPLSSNDGRSWSVTTAEHQELLPDLRRWVADLEHLGLELHGVECRSAIQRMPFWKDDIVREWNRVAAHARTREDDPGACQAFGSGTGGNLSDGTR